MNKKTLIAIVIYCSSSFGTHAQSLVKGVEVGEDRCDAVVIVKGLRPTPGNYLTVRSGPGRSYDYIGRVLQGQKLWLCEENDHWAGIIIDSSIKCLPTKLGKYDGPCTAGWVSKRYIELLAG